ncbi:hypothetical protein [Fluviicola taffensis]|uniref:hypothetical protein n=1 Tax=Fluviicola taffensis TaxID=191579 RepID=UPI00313827E3
MKFYLLLLFIPFGCLAQFPFDTQNGDFHMNQRQKMLSLGFHNVDVKVVNTETGTGNEVQSWGMWNTFDDSNRVIVKGILNNRGDSTQTTIRYHSNGKRHSETELNGYGKVFYYDEIDSLIRVENIPSRLIPHLYFYDQLNDSTTRVRIYYDDKDHFISSQVYVRNGNTVYCTDSSASTGECYQSKRVMNEFGQTVEFRSQQHNTTRRYTYDSLGRTIKEELERDFGQGKGWEYFFTYDTNGNLIREVMQNDDQLTVIRIDYEFRDGFLVNETFCDYSEDPIDTFTTYIYYSNGLLKTATKMSGEHEEIAIVKTYTYH